MKKRIGTQLCLLLVVLFISLPISVKADTGPKPSVRIGFTNGPEEEFYVTLLAKAADTPYGEGGLSSISDQAVWEIVKTYRTDLHLLNYLQRCSEQDEFNWGYYPPSSFTVLVYFPGSGTFAESGLCERYAFRSVFTADLSQAAEGKITVKDHALIRSELLSIAVRLLITVGIELAIAVFLFRLKEKKTVFVILAANVITQIILNLILMNSKLAFSFFRGGWGMFLLIPLELLIFGAEALAYVSLIRTEGHTKGQLVGYAALANLISFIAGILLSTVLD